MIRYQYSVLQRHGCVAHLGMLYDCIKTRQSHRVGVAVKLHRNKEYIQDTETWSINSCHFSIVARLFVRSCPFRKVVYQINARNSVSFHTTPHRYEISPPSPRQSIFLPISSPCACYLHRRHSESSLAGSREAGRPTDIPVGIRRSRRRHPVSSCLVSSLPGNTRFA